MATRSHIGMVNEDGTVKVVYCHWDGYPSHQVPILTVHYNTKEKVEALIEGGSLSVLGASTECPEGHTFDTPERGYCVYYGRDRGREEHSASRI